MYPTTPILEDYELPVTNIAEYQEEYKTLPVYRYDDGTLLSRWKLSWKERLAVLLTGNVYLWQMTFNSPVQPIMLEASAPKIEL